MKNNFADNVKLLRKERGLTQGELAKEIGVITRTVSYWETGGQECSLDMLIKVAQFFGVSTDVLLGLAEY